MNKQRPASVKVIGWFWRVGGIAGMVFALPLALMGGEWWGSYWADSIRTLSPGVLFVWAFLASLICLLMGNGILRGRNWARVSILAYCAASTLIGIAIYRHHPIIWFNAIANLAFTGAMGFFLYRSDSTAFFQGDLEVLSGETS